MSKFRYIIYPEYIYTLEYIDGTIEISGQEIIDAFKINPADDE